MTGEELEMIYNEAYRAVYWTAMSLLKNEADAEDVVQDTFVAFIESYSDIKDTSKATALLKKIAANKCLNRLKLSKTDNAEDEFFENVEAVPEDFLPDTIIESAEMRKIIMDIINNSLSEDVRRTLILFYFNEMSTKEIAELLGIPQGTVLWRLNFAKKKIKKEVEKYEEDNDTKLFGMVIPFLSKLFTKESEQVAFKPMPASLANLSASVKAPSNGAGLKASSGAIRKGTDIMKTKILIGCIAGVAAVGVTVGIVAGIVSKTGNSKGGDILSKVVEEESGAASGNNSSTVNIGESSVDSSVVTVSEASDFNENISISLEEMSVDEIVSNLDSIRTITSKDSIEDYTKRLSIMPVNVYEDNDSYSYFWYVRSIDYADNPDEKPKTFMNLSAFVSQITLSEITSESDGKIKLGSDSYHAQASVLMEFKDMDTAKKVYEAIIAKFFNEDGFEDFRKDTSWHAYCYGCTVNLLFEDEYDSGTYALTVTFPIVDRTN